MGLGGVCAWPGREQGRGRTRQHREAQVGVLGGIPGGFAEGRGDTEQSVPEPAGLSPHVGETLLLGSAHSGGDQGRDSTGGGGQVWALRGSSGAGAGAPSASHTPPCRSLGAQVRSGTSHLPAADGPSL